MRLSPLDRKLLRDLLKLKGQIIAISLVIASGISTFVAMLSVLDSLEGAMRTYYDRRRFADAFVYLTRAPERIGGELASVEGVASVETRVVASVTLDIEGTEEAVTGRLVSIPEFGGPALNDLFLRLGRFPEPRREDEVLVSEAFAEAHGFEPGDSLYAIINERRKRLRIVGVALSPEYVYSIRPGGVLPDDRLFGILWMRREALGTAFDMDGAFNNATFSLTRSAREAHVVAEIDRILEPYGGLGAYLRKDQESNWFLQSELTQLRSIGVVMPIVFLGVAAFLLNVVLSRLVEQQRDQIALLKAFGYTNIQVGIHFAKMVVVVVVFAGVFGTLGGAWMGKGMIGLYADFYRFPALDYVFQARYLIQALFIGAVAAMLGTLKAIRDAVRLPPAEAMRPQAPATYRPSVVEKLGVKQWFGPSSLMVLRGLERRPVKAALSVLGIGCGVALLVVGNSLMDSMQFIMEAQFQVAQREDVRLSLIEPRSMKALYDLERLPGVIRAEPYRSVAARLHSGHRSRRSAISGVTQGATLQRLIDEDLKPVSLPPDGLLLSTKLAAILRVGLFEPVTVEVLEGRRPTFTVPVTRIVESFIGMNAYMDFSALNERLGEGSTLSGANMLVDRHRMGELHQAIKNTPVIAGVELRQEAILSFEKTAAESMGIMTFFMTVFAVVIACGVVYNNARIILGERTRELASMRVLGYRRSEISWILLGELWLLTAVAIPFGVAMGYGLTALLCRQLDSELYRIPLIIQPDTFGLAASIVAGASIVSGLVVRRSLDHLDLVEVLKTRE